MTRITTTLIIWLVLSNGAITIMASTGLSEDLGVELAPGISDSMDDVVEEMRNGFNPQIAIVGTLISLFLAGLNILQVLIEGVFAAPTMFINLGFPAEIVGALFAPAYIIATLEMVFVATGRDLV